MPEIWLRYGSTDVVLDIRFENLLNHISSSFNILPEEEIRAAAGRAPITDNMMVLALSSSRAAARMISLLSEISKVKGFADITIDVPHGIASALRSNLAGIPVSINRVEYQSLQDRMKKFQSAMIISQVTYDPLFGFAGAPTLLLRNFFAEQMSEAFNARRGNLPAPGVQGRPLKIAALSAEGIPANSIELVANSAGIAGVHAGSVAEAFSKAVAHLGSIPAVEVEPVKSAVISASGEIGPHSTLAGSLNSLWNSVHVVKENGTAVLLAENRDGIGGGALQMHIEGRLKPEQLRQKQYIDGLEHLLYIEELRQKYELGIVSTLPQYYSKVKLGFSSYSGMKDVVEKLLAKHGKNHKVLVLSDADITLLKAKI